MEVKTYIKNLKISPRKLRYLLPTIKKMSPYESLHSLLYMQKKAARFYYQAIKSAISNAKSTFKVDEKLLKFKTLTVEEGMRLKRFQPGGRGTAKPYKKRSAHIRIVLIADTKAVKKISNVKSQMSKPKLKSVNSKKENKKDKKI